ncbi:phage tail protein [Parashewanella curva]|uniref:Phage tail protein n=1 Tax=Parashewanella curva TaxID=2338552 RepID=A0A3L8PZX3_9GAMM|nr:tape measure protein [Parashewanella curva]RLV61006.1 phage tail protein [Parashewanella curva]
MAFKDQVVNFIIKGRDLFSSVAKKSEKALAQLANESETLNERLEELGDLDKAVNSFDELSRTITKSEKAFLDNSVALDKLRSEQRQAAKDLKALETAQKKANASVDGIEKEYKQAQTALSGYETEIKQAEQAIARLSAEQEKGGKASKAQTQALAKAKTDLQGLTAAQAKAENNTRQFALELDKQRRVLVESNVAVDKAAKAKAELGLKSKTASSELTKLGNSINRNKSKLKTYTDQITKAGFDTGKLADASRELKQQQAAGESALTGVNKKLARHNRLLSQSSKSAKDFNGSIGSATSSLLAMAGAYIGVDRLWESLKGVLTVGDQMRAFREQMTAAMGSIAEGERATAWIKEFANDTGSKLDTIKEAFVRLKAFGLDPMQGSLQSLVDYNTKLGGSQEKLEGIILAVGQAWAKQKLQGEEILQLVDRGVPVWDLLEKVTGKNVVQLQKLSEQGQLGRETIKLLFDEMGRQAKGQASKSLDRLSGQVNVLINKWQDFQEKIAESGALDVAIEALKELNAKFDELNQNGKIKQAAQDISDFFSAIIKDGGESLKGTLENITAFTKALSITSASIRIAWNGITAGISTVAGVVTAAFAKMGEVYTKFLNLIGADELAKKMEYQVGALKAISEGYKQQVQQDGEDIRKAWQVIAGESERSSQRIKKATNSTSESIKKASQTVTDAMSAQKSEAKALELAMEKAGIKTISVLKEQASAAKDTYTKAKQALEQNLITQEQFNEAFLKYAELQVQVAAATDEAVDKKLFEEAANLKLSASLSQIIEKTLKLKEVQKGQADNNDKIKDSVGKVGKEYGKLGVKVKKNNDVIKRSALETQANVQAVATAFTGYLQNVTNRVAKYGEKAKQYFRSIINNDFFNYKAKSQVEELDEKLKNVNKRIEYFFQKAQDPRTSAISRMARQWQVAAGKAERLYLQQQKSMVGIINDLEDVDYVNVRMIERAEQASKSFSILNNQDLSRLTNAIDAAKNKMNELKQSAKETVSSIQDELDEFEGRQADIERRRYEQELASLRAKLEAAKVTGDKNLIADLKRAESNLKKIYEYRKDELERQQAQDQQQQKQRQQQQVKRDQERERQQKVQLTPRNPNTINQPPRAVSSAPVQRAELTLVVGNQRFQLETKNSILQELLQEIERQKSVGG